MALRSRSRTATPSSGPGRPPGSDGRTAHRLNGRTAHRLRHSRGRPRRPHQTSAADALRLRAQALFAEGTMERRELGNGPPGADREVGETRGAREAGEEGEAREKTTTGDGTGRPPGLGGFQPVRPSGFGAAGDPTPADGGADSPVHGSAGVHGTAGRAWRERIGSAVRERMPLWLQSRCGLERKSVAALGVLLVLAAVFAAQHFWAGRSQLVRAPDVVRAAARSGTPGAQGHEGSAEPGVSPGARSAGGAGVGAGTGAAVVVDVSGMVRKPGLQRLPAGSRVADALLAAGGVRPGTNTDGLNRARLLVDGEQIVVGGSAPATGMGPAGSATGGSVPGGPAAGAAPATPVSLNTATVDQLETLPGVGPVLAQHIIAYRSQHGGFRSVDELREVNGIGGRRFADLRSLVRP